jgi:hypothetical protein
MSAIEVKPTMSEKNIVSFFRLASMATLCCPVKMDA